MTAVLLAWAVAGVLAGEGNISPAEAPGLVPKLVSGRARERADAEAALVKLGRPAIPALEEGRRSRDLELRTSSARVLDRIDAASLLGPTSVSIAIDRLPLLDALEAFRLQSQQDLALEGSLAVQHQQQKPPQTVRLKISEPVPFWEALDLFCNAANLRPMVDANQMPFVNRGMVFGGLRPPRPVASASTLILGRDDGSSPPAPFADSGSIRVVLTDLRLHRDRVLTRPRSGGAYRAGLVRFEAQVQVLAEPRLALAKLENLRCTEAVDDLGQSLVPDGTTPAVSNANVPAQMGGMVSRLGPQVIALKYPDRPGSLIRLLQGTVRATVVGREEKPFLVASLKDDLGKTLRKGDDSLLVHRVLPGQNGQGMGVELTMTALGGLARAGFYAPGDPRTELGLGPPVTNVPQLDLVDAQGRLCQAYALGSYNLGDGMRKSLPCNIPAGVGSPVEVRYHRLVWAELDVPFAFHNLPMP